jgi:hypothetical protein
VNDYEIQVLFKRESRYGIMCGYTEYLTQLQYIITIYNKSIVMHGLI